MGNIKLFALLVLAFAYEVNAEKKCFPVTTDTILTTETTILPCSITCQEGWAFDEVNCDCIPPPPCEPKECERGYTFFPEPICECHLICDYIMECPKGEEWDFIECGCVNKCPGTICPENYVPDDDCNCQCGLSQETCAEYEKFDPSDCTCRPDWGCDYIMECPLGEIWSLGVCGCVPNECPGSEKCPENQAFDAYCNCQCIENGDNCDGYFDTGSCTCFHEGCDYIEECPFGMTWDGSDEVCSCVPRVCDGEPCGENYAFDENCQCQCAITQEYCDAFDPATQLIGCECIYVDPCFEQPCPEGEVWDFNECQCVDKCPDTSCLENYVVDSECNCQCGFTQESCAPGEDFNSNDCQCYPHMGCDYIMECPLGQRWDRSDDVCACVPIVCEGEPCSENYAFDENCQCQCTITQEYCNDNHPGSQVVGCECIYYDPCFEQPCSEGEIWDFQVCHCVPDQTTHDTTTECVEQVCRNRYVWLQPACQCVCPPMYCEEGTIRGNDCDCIPDPDYTTPMASSSSESHKSHSNSHETHESHGDKTKSHESHGGKIKSHESHIGKIKSHVKSPKDNGRKSDPPKEAEKKPDPPKDAEKKPDPSKEAEKKPDSPDPKESSSKKGPK